MKPRAAGASVSTREKCSKKTEKSEKPWFHQVLNLGKFVQWFSCVLYLEVYPVIKVVLQKVMLSWAAESQTETLLSFVCERTSSGVSIFELPNFKIKANSS